MLCDHLLTNVENLASNNLISVLASANYTHLQILPFSYFSHDLQLYNYFKELILQSWACLVPCSGRGPDGIQVEALLQRPRRRMES